MQPLAKIEVVCLGVAKRVAVGAFVAFEFRLRVIASDPPMSAGQPLSWSCVFPIKPGMDIPPEGFLHLPQKQKFAPFIFLERKTIVIERANVSLDETGGRLTLTDQSLVTLGKKFEQWDQYLQWSPKSAIERIRKHRPGPLDLETELQEEIVLVDYTIGAPEEYDVPGQKVCLVTAGNFTFSGIVGSAAEGKTLLKNFDDLRKLKKDCPPLFGLMHYERCRLTFQALTAFRPEPDYLTISKENVNKASLLKAMSFT